MEDKKSPLGLWEACGQVELSVTIELTTQLAPFQMPISNCYEAGVQAPTLKGKRHHNDDMRLAALFLKRTLNDLRSTWLLAGMGYTSQAASVCAALFEHGLAVNALAGHPQNAKKLLKTKSGDLPWSPIELSKILAEQHREEAGVTKRSFKKTEYEQAWREVYSAYKFLCKIKHPTIRSAAHDAFSASVREDEYVVMAAPDLRPEDLPLKATILMIAVSRTYQAIRRFALALKCDSESPAYKDFIGRMSGIVPAAVEAYKRLASSPLLFDISDSALTEEYRNLREQKQPGCASEKEEG